MGENISNGMSYEPNGWLRKQSGGNWASGVAGKPFEEANEFFFMGLQDPNGVYSHVMIGVTSGGIKNDERGSHKSNNGNFLESDILSVKIESDGTVKFRKNYQDFRTCGLKVTFPAHVDASFHDGNEKAQVRILGYRTNPTNEE